MRATRAVLAVLAAGCGDVLPAAEPFASPRILAVAANPPALGIGPGGIVELTPLVVDAAGNDITDDPRLELRWRVCNPWEPVSDPDVDCGPEDSYPLSFLDTDQRRAWLSFPLLREVFPPPVPVPLPVPDDYFDQPGLCPVDRESILVPVVLEARFEGYRLLAFKLVPIDSAGDWRNPAIETLRLDDGLLQEGDTQYFAPGQRQRAVISVEHELPAACDETLLYAYLADGDVEPPSQEVFNVLAQSTVSLDLPEDRGTTLWLVVTQPKTGGVSWRSLRLEPRAP